MIMTFFRQLAGQDRPAREFQRMEPWFGHQSDLPQIEHDPSGVMHVEQRVPKPHFLPALIGSQLSGAMARKQKLARLADLSGFVGACVMDGSTGISLASTGRLPLQIEYEAQVYAPILRAARIAAEMTVSGDPIEDIVIKTTASCQILRPLVATGQVFLMLSVQRRSANLALARIAVERVAAELPMAE